MAVSRLDSATVEKKVLETIRSLLENLGGSRALAAVDLHAALDRDLGLGSLELVELVSRLEEAFGVELSESVLAEAGTAADLVGAILSSRAPAARARPIAAPVAPVPSIPVTAETLVEVLIRRAEMDPQRPHVYLLDESGRETILRYGELHAEATEIARGLAGRGIDTGDPVALMLPTSRDFFTSFAGILLAGGIPVPLYPPFSLERIEEYATRQAGILKNCGARVLVTVQHGRSIGHLLRSPAPSLRHVTTVEALRMDVGATPRVAIHGDAPALIQYTSGSTGDPKGVLLAHKNLLANIRAIGKAMDLRSTDVGVSWLPLYHDMGLIGCWLTPLVFGFPITIMSPLTFLSRPEQWLWTIHARRATLSASPNFGYELCVRRLKDEVLEGLDLSSWRGALNGAEPISASTIDRFTARFSRFGFRPESMRPVYGLAESSLALAVTPPDRAPRVERIAREPFEREGRALPATEKGKEPFHFVSSGHPIPGHELRVVDEPGTTLPERVEGNLQFRGPS
ncbi:MAG TPA: AMP-binding protein, partial [Vicinamibacteria bacterium]